MTFTGDQIDDICKDSNNNNHGNDQLETPIPRHQINGKNKQCNLHKPDRIELWKNAVLHYFRVEKTTLLKDGTVVVKIICDLWR